MSEPIRDLETAVRELGALPMPAGPEPQMPSEQRAAVAELIGDAKPATARLIEQLAKSVRDRREHEHPTWEDLYCLNLVSWMGERMGPVLRRLLDAETERAAFRDQRNAVFATNSELLTKVEESGQARLRAENETRTVKRQFAEAAAEVARLVQERGQRMKLENALRDQITGLESDRSANDREYEAATARIAELEAERHTTNATLSDAAEALRRQRDRITALEAAPTTVYRASHDSIAMGLYRTREAAQAHCEAAVQQEEPAGSIRHLSWSADDIGDDAEYELHITPAETGGLIRGTGYVVTPLEVAAEHDADADE